MARGEPFTRTLDAVVTSFPRSEHRFRLALATQGVADAERRDSRTGMEGGDEVEGKNSYLFDKLLI